MKMEKTLVYALNHCVTHLCKGGMVKIARDLMFQFEYLLERAKLGPEHMLVKDCLRIVGSGGDDIRNDRAFNLLYSALRLSQSGLRKSMVGKKPKWKALIKVTRVQNASWRECMTLHATLREVLVDQHSRQRLMFEMVY